MNYQNEVIAMAEIEKDPTPVSSLSGIEAGRAAARLFEAETLLARSADKLREAMQYWDTPSKPGLFRSNASVLTDQIEAFLSTTVTEGE